jgi:hypothetical protein
MLVDPVDTEAIAHGIRRLAEGDASIADLRQRELARAERFTWQKGSQDFGCLAGCVGGRQVFQPYKRRSKKSAKLDR